MLGLEKRLERNNLPVKIILVLITLIILGSVYNGLKRFIMATLIETLPVKSGVLDQRIEGEGLVFLDEKIITAPYSGNLKRIIASEQRVAQGQQFADFEAFGTTQDGHNVNLPLKSPGAGVLLYWSDGIEGIFNEDILGTSNINNLYALPKITFSNETVRQGQTIAKVIDNLNDIFFVAKFPIEMFKAPLQKDETVRFLFNKVSVPAIVKDFKSDAGELYILAKLDSLPNDFYKGRKMSCTLIKEEFKGTILPESALVSKNNSVGVYVVDSKRAKWKQVSLIGAVGKKVVVSGLNFTELVIINPEWVKDNEFVE